MKALTKFLSRLRWPIGPPNALMPDDVQEYQLRHMVPGEVRYTTPWGMWADAYGRLWLNGKYTASEKPGGTVKLSVKRLADGYEVSNHLCPTERWGHTDSTAWDHNKLQVVSFIFTPHETTPAEEKDDAESGQGPTEDS